MPAFDTENAFQTALHLHRDGRLTEAETLYRNILGVAPDHADSLHLLGVIASQRGQHGSAIETIGRAIALSGGKPVPAFHKNIGLAFLASDRPVEAIAHFRQAATQNPANAEIHSYLGTALRATGQNDEAVDCFRRAAALRPDDAEVHYNLGLMLRERDDLPGAIQSYRQACALRPNWAEAHSNLGSALQRQGRLDDAVACFRQAAALKPEAPDLHRNLGGALNGLGRFEEAADCFRRALVLSPRDPELHYGLAVSLHEQDRLDEAAALYRKTLDIDPGRADAQYHLHGLLLDPADPGPAIRCLEQAVAIEPDNIKYRFFLGVMLDYRGDAPAAEKQFALVERGPRLYREQLDSWRHLKSAAPKLPAAIGNRIDAFRLCLNKAPQSGLVLEFGVRFGHSIRLISDLARQDVHGFDSFEGLPEDWHGEPRGTYSTNGELPAVPPNVALHRGWFTDTLPAFLAQHPGPVRFMNIDCDLYSSTKQVLDMLADRIVPGTVIVFDEYIGSEFWREDEFKAFQESVAHYGWRYEYLCFSFYTRQAAIRIL